MIDDRDGDDISMTKAIAMMLLLMVDDHDADDYMKI